MKQAAAIEDPDKTVVADATTGDRRAEGSHVSAAAYKETTTPPAHEQPATETSQGGYIIPTVGHCQATDRKPTFRAVAHYTFSGAVSTQEESHATT